MEYLGVVVQKNIVLIDGSPSPSYVAEVVSNVVDACGVAYLAATPPTDLDAAVSRLGDLAVSPLEGSTSTVKFEVRKRS